MRLASLLLLGFSLAAALPSSPQAATISPPGIESQSSNVIEVDRRCGEHRHYVRGHRSRRDGHWIRGQCFRNRDRD
jgi:hypothetical protein